MNINNYITVAQISKRLNINISSAQYWVRKLGIKYKVTIPMADKTIGFISLSDFEKIKEVRSESVYVKAKQRKKEVKM